MKSNPECHWNPNNGWHTLSLPLVATDHGFVVAVIAAAAADFAVPTAAVIRHNDKM